MLFMVSLVSIILLLRKAGLDFPWMDKFEYNLKSKISEIKFKNLNINKIHSEKILKTNVTNPLDKPAAKQTKITPTKIFKGPLKI